MSTEPVRRRPAWQREGCAVSGQAAQLRGEVGGEAGQGGRVVAGLLNEIPDEVALGAITRATTSAVSRGHPPTTATPGPATSRSVPRRVPEAQAEGGSPDSTAVCAASLGRVGEHRWPSSHPERRVARHAPGQVAHRGTARPVSSSAADALSARCMSGSAVTTASPYADRSGNWTRSAGWPDRRDLLGAEDVQPSSRRRHCLG